MKTLMEAAVLLGETRYDEDLHEDSMWGTVLWALGALNR